MMYACFKRFNTIPSSSEELQVRLEMAQMYRSISNYVVTVF